MKRTPTLLAWTLFALGGCATAIGLHDLSPPVTPPEDSAVCLGTQTVVPAAASFCATGRSCWQNPAPTGANLYHAWGTCGDAWTVGKGGELAHWDGAKWLEVPSGVMTDLFRIGGTSRTDVWFAGDLGTMLHWDGTTVSATDLPGGLTDPIIAVWAASLADAWALGAPSSGTSFLHWDGIAWSHVMEQETKGVVYTALWGSGADDVWAVGVGGAASHWNGKAWTEARSAITGNLTRVWGSGPTDVWATSDAHAMQHWNGSAWTIAEIGLATDETPTDVWGGSASDIWVATDTALHHFDGLTWHVVTGAPDLGAPLGPDITAGWSLGAGQTFMVGATGLIIHGDGENLTRMDAGFRENVRAIYGEDASSVWLVGNNGLIDHWDGSHFESLRTTDTDDLTAVWGDGTSGVWVAGQNRLRHVVVNGGQSESFTLGADTSLNGVWTDNGTVVWAAGLISTGPAIFRYTQASRWTSVAIDGGPVAGAIGFTAMHGSGPDNVWAVGNAGAVAHWNGKTWTLGSTGFGAPMLHTVLAIAPDDVWVAGNVPLDFSNIDVVLHYDGKTWSTRPGPFDSTCSCIPTCALACYSFQRLWAPLGEKSPWFGSSRGAIHHWDGMGWRQIGAGAGNDYALYGTYDNGNALVLWSGGAGGAVRTLRP